MRTLGLAAAAIATLIAAAPAHPQSSTHRRRTTRTATPPARSAPVRAETYPARTDPYPARAEAYPSGADAYSTRTEASTPREDPYARAQEPAEPASTYAAAPPRPTRRVGSRYEPREDAPSDLERTPHDGVYVRADGGAAYMYVALPTGTDGRYTGVATVGAIHAGATVQDKALLGVQLWGAALGNPTHTSAEGALKSGLNLYTFGVGPELALYLSPSNLHVSAAVGATWLTVQAAKGSARSKPGLGGRFEAGHEWWLSQRWGLGLAAALSFQSNQLELDTGGWVPFSSWTAGLVATMTFN